MKKRTAKYAKYAKYTFALGVSVRVASPIGEGEGIRGARDFLRNIMSA